jgi:hypothetical protein
LIGGGNRLTSAHNDRAAIKGLSDEKMIDRGNETGACLR